MNPIRSFVVRIYRQDRRSIAGVVEDVRTGNSTFFQSFSDLWDALTTRSRASMRANGNAHAGTPAGDRNGAGGPGGAQTDEFTKP